MTSPVPGAHPALLTEAVPRSRRGVKWAWWLGSGLGAALVAAAILAQGHILTDARTPTRDRDGSATVPRAAAPPTVAVVGLENRARSAESGWIATAAAEILSRALIMDGRLRAVPADVMWQVQKEMGALRGESLHRESLSRLRELVGAQWVIAGSYLALEQKDEGQIRLDLRLQNTGTGALSPPVTAAGEIDRLPELLLASLPRLLAGVGLVEPSGFQRHAAVFPSSTRGWTLLVAALEELRSGHGEKARAHLEEAVIADPHSPLVRQALASVLVHLGDQAGAAGQARKAVELSRTLPEETRAATGALYLELSSRWDEALGSYRELFAERPHDVELGFRLLRSQLAAGFDDEALETIDALAGLDLSPWDGIRLDLARAEVARFRGDLSQQRSLARQAAEAAEDLDVAHLAARGHQLEGEALLRLDEGEDALAALERARRMFEASADLEGVGRSLSAQALAHHRAGELDRAARTYLTSLEQLRGAGNPRLEARVLNSLALVERHRGDAEAAEKRYREAVEVQRRTGDGAGLASTQTRLAELRAQQGDLIEAQTLLEEALTLREEVGDTSGRAACLVQLAKVLDRQDLRAEAKQSYEEALALAAEERDRSIQADALFGLGQLLLSEGRLESAQLRHEEALALRNELGEREAVAQSRIAVANLALETGRPKEAEVLARQASEELSALGVRDSRALAQAVTAWALLEQGKAAAGKRHIDLALSLAAEKGDETLRLTLLITAARIDAALGHRRRAMRRLEGVLEDASSAGILTSSLEAKLALGEIELDAGETKSARKRLAAVEQDATRAGLILLADKARAARHAG